MGIGKEVPGGAGDGGAELGSQTRYSYLHVAGSLLEGPAVLEAGANSREVSAKGFTARAWSQTDTGSDLGSGTSWPGTLDRLDFSGLCCLQSPVWEDGGGWSR